MAEKIKELKCEKCGGVMYKSRKSLGMMGLLIMGLGIIAMYYVSSFLGIILIIVGLIAGFKIRYFWVCGDCGYKFEREKIGSVLELVKLKATFMWRH